MITPGRHTAVCRSIQFGTTKKGIDQAAVEFQIVGDGPDSGSSITWYAFFSDAALKRSLESLRHTGWDGIDLADLPALADSGKLTSEVQLVIEHEEYNGKVNAKVKWVNALNGGRVKLEKPMDAGGLRALADRIKNGGPSPAPSGMESGNFDNRGGADDDLPF